MTVLSPHSGLSRCDVGDADPAQAPEKGFRKEARVELNFKS